MSKTLNKQSFINHLEHEGFSFVDATKAVEKIILYMRTNLEKGNAINFTKIGKIVPHRRKAGKVKMFGKEVVAGDRLKLKIVTSQTLGGTYNKRKGKSLL